MLASLSADWFPSRNVSLRSHPVASSTVLCSWIITLRGSSPGTRSISNPSSNPPFLSLFFYFGVNPHSNPSSISSSILEDKIWYSIYRVIVWDKEIEDHPKPLFENKCKKVLDLYCEWIMIGEKGEFFRNRDEHKDIEVCNWSLYE